jgi:hypothetical protein
MVTAMACLAKNYADEPPDSRASAPLREGIPQRSVCKKMNALKIPRNPSDRRHRLNTPAGCLGIVRRAMGEVGEA